MRIGSDVLTVEEPLEALEHAIQRLMVLEQKRLGALLAQHGLRIPEFFALVHLARCPDGCTMSALADELLQSNATMTGIVDGLEAHQMVTRTRGTGPDRRTVVVQLTRPGREFLKRSKEARRQHLRRALESLPPHQVRVLVHLLDAYVHQLEETS